MTNISKHRRQATRAGRPAGYRSRKNKATAAPSGRVEKTDLSIIVSGAPTGLGAEVRRAARLALQSQKYLQGRLEIAIVDGAEMRRQHKQWMGRACVTDVLSFDLRDRPRRGRVDGQLIVCEAVARCVARLHDTDWRGELLLYVVHGCLHLCGHDDHRLGDAARMHEQEDKLLSLSGWGPVFAGPPSGQASRKPRAGCPGRGQA